MKYLLISLLIISCKTANVTNNKDKSKIVEQKNSGLMATLLVPTMIRKKIQAKKKFPNSHNIKSSNGNAKKEVQKEREKIMSDREKLKDKEKEFIESKEKNPEKNISEKVKDSYEKEKGNKGETETSEKSESTENTNENSKDEDKVVQEDSDYDDGY